MEQNPDQTGPLASYGEDATAVRVNGTNVSEADGTSGAPAVYGGTNGSIANDRVTGTNVSEADGTSGAPAVNGGTNGSEANDRSGIIESKLTDEQILEHFELSSDMLLVLTEDELTELADSARYANVTVKMFVRARLRIMKRAAVAEEKGPPGHKEKFSEKENDTGQQGKQVNFDRPDVNNSNVDYVYIAPSYNSDRIRATGSKCFRNQSIDGNNYFRSENVVSDSNNIDVLADESERLMRAKLNRITPLADESERLMRVRHIQARAETLEKEFEKVKRDLADESERLRRESQVQTKANIADRGIPADESERLWHGTPQFGNREVTEDIAEAEKPVEAPNGYGNDQPSLRRTEDHTGQILDSRQNQRVLLGNFPNENSTFSGHGNDQTNVSRNNNFSGASNMVSNHNISGFTQFRADSTNFSGQIRPRETENAHISRSLGAFYENHGSYPSTVLGPANPPSWLESRSNHYTPSVRTRNDFSEPPMAGAARTVFDENRPFLRSDDSFGGHHGRPLPTIPSHGNLQDSLETRPNQVSQKSERFKSPEKVPREPAKSSIFERETPDFWGARDSRRPHGKHQEELPGDKTQGQWLESQPNHYPEKSTSKTAPEGPQTAELPRTVQNSHRDQKWENWDDADPKRFFGNFPKRFLSDIPGHPSQFGQAPPTSHQINATDKDMSKAFDCRDFNHNDAMSRRWMQQDTTGGRTDHHHGRPRAFTDGYENEEDFEEDYSGRPNRGRGDSTGRMQEYRQSNRGQGKGNVTDDPNFTPEQNLIIRAFPEAITALGRTERGRGSCPFGRVVDFRRGTRSDIAIMKFCDPPWEGCGDKKPLATLLTQIDEKCDAEDFTRHDLVRVIKNSIDERLRMMLKKEITTGQWAAEFKAAKADNDRYGIMLAALHQIMTTDGKGTNDGSKAKYDLYELKQKDKTLKDYTKEFERRVNICEQTGAVLNPEDLRDLLLRNMDERAYEKANNAGVFKQTNWVQLCQDLRAHEEWQAGLDRARKGGITGPTGSPKRRMRSPSPGRDRKSRSPSRTPRFRDRKGRFMGRRNFGSNIGRAGEGNDGSEEWGSSDSIASYESNLRDWEEYAEYINELPETAYLAVAKEQSNSERLRFVGECYLYRDKGECPYGDRCRFAHINSGQTARKSRGRECFICNKMGHWAKDCPDRENRRGGGKGGGKGRRTQDDTWSSTAKNVAIKPEAEIISDNNGGGNTKTYQAAINVARAAAAVPLSGTKFLLACELENTLHIVFGNRTISARVLLDTGASCNMINEAEADRLVQMGIAKLEGILLKPINIVFGNGKTENGQRILSLEIEEFGSEPLLFLMVPELYPVTIIGKAQLKKSPAVLKRCLASRCRAESTGSQDTGTTNDGISWPDETDNLTGKCKERSEGPEEAESLRTTDTSRNIYVRSEEAESFKATQRDGRADKEKVRENRLKLLIPAQDNGSGNRARNAHGHGKYPGFMERTDMLRSSQSF